MNNCGLGASFPWYQWCTSLSVKVGGQGCKLRRAYSKRWHAEADTCGFIISHASQRLADHLPGCSVGVQQLITPWWTISTHSWGIWRNCQFNTWLITVCHGSRFNPYIAEWSPYHGAAYAVWSNCSFEWLLVPNWSFLLPKSSVWINSIGIWSIMLKTLLSQAQIQQLAIYRLVRTLCLVPLKKSPCRNPVASRGDDSG